MSTSAKKVGIFIIVFFIIMYYGWAKCNEYIGGQTGGNSLIILGVLLAIAILLGYLCSLVFTDQYIAQDDRIKIGAGILVALVICYLLEPMYIKPGSITLLAACIGGLIYYFNRSKPKQKNEIEYTDNDQPAREPITNNISEQSGLNVTGARQQLWNKKGHLLTCGFARGGKGSTILLPALLDPRLRLYDAPSFIVLDPKGENLAVSGKYLQSAGYDVMCINPFQIAEIQEFGNTRFNPFEGVFNARHPNADKYIDLITWALVPPSRSNSPFFDDSARDLISLYIRHMLTQDEEPINFRTLYRWLRLSGVDRFDLLAKMGVNTEFEGVIQDNAMALMGQLSEGGGKEVESVFSTVRTHTSIFGNAQLRKSLEQSDFRIEDLNRGKTALFVCLKPEDLKQNQAWLRIFFGTLLRKMTETYNPDRKTVVILDEFPVLGYEKTIEESMGFIAGYNVTIWPVIQDLNQLRSNYPNSWETFVGNAMVRHWVSIGDNFTADYVSKRMPMDLKFTGSNADGSPRYEQKPLLTAQEILNFPDIILESSSLDRPDRLKKIPYWQFLNNYSPNPFYRS